MQTQKKWKDLNRSQKSGIVALGIMQFSLLIAALWDIRRRPANQINGSKKLWTGIAFINFVGPLSYFVFGRKG